MANPFQKKTWQNRLSEFPTRRQLVDVDTGTTQTVDVTRDEGQVYTTGDGFTQVNMNDLEQRIYDAFGRFSPGEILVNSVNLFGLIKDAVDNDRSNFQLVFDGNHEYLCGDQLLSPEIFVEDKNKLDIRIRGFGSSLSIPSISILVPERTEATEEGQWHRNLYALPYPVQATTYQKRGSGSSYAMAPYGIGYIDVSAMETDFGFLSLSFSLTKGYWTIDWDTGDWTYVNDYFWRSKTYQDGTGSYIQPYLTITA